MKQKETILIHDKPISFTLMGLFFVSCMVVMNVVHIWNMQMDACKQLEKEHYTVDMVYLYDSLDSKERIEKIDFRRLNITKGNVIVVFNTVVGNAYSTAPIHLVAVSNEPLVEELKTGRFPTENEIEYGRKCVVIGEGLKRLTEKVQSGEVLRIDGIEYDVIGILKDITGDGSDNRIIVYHNCYAENLLNGLDGSYSFFVEYGSNVENSLQQKQLLAWLNHFIPNSKMKESTNSQFDAMDDMRTMATLLRQYIKFSLYGLYVFCLIGCLIVSKIWISRKEKEIIIRKTLGSEMFEIVIVLLKDLGIMMGIAVVMSCVAIFLWGLFSGESWISEEYMPRNLVSLFCSTLFVIVLSFFRPLYVAFTINPAEEISK